MKIRFRAIYDDDPRQNSNIRLDLDTADPERIADKLLVMKAWHEWREGGWALPDVMYIRFDGGDCHDLCESDFEKMLGHIRENRPEILLSIAARLFRQGSDRSEEILRKWLPGFFFYEVHSHTEKDPLCYADDESIIRMAKASPWPVIEYLTADHSLAGSELAFIERFERNGIKFTHCDSYRLVKIS